MKTLMLTSMKTTTTTTTRMRAFCRCKYFGLRATVVWFVEKRIADTIYLPPATLRKGVRFSFGSSQRRQIFKNVLNDDSLVTCHQFLLFLIVVYIFDFILYSFSSFNLKCYSLMERCALVSLYCFRVFVLNFNIYFKSETALFI